jgi:hypothetical protein
MRNITTQFGLFESTNGILYKVTIECETSDPDWIGEFSVYGTGKDKREAAIFALATAWMVNIGDINNNDPDPKPKEEPAIHDLRDAITYIEQYSNVEEDIKSMIDDNFDSDYFGDHGTESDVSIEWEEIEDPLDADTRRGSNMLRRFGSFSDFDLLGGYVVYMDHREREYEDDQEDNG